jgi:hypothetical protein
MLPLHYLEFSGYDPETEIRFLAALSADKLILRVVLTAFIAPDYLQG